jgi:dipeptidyl aminopeptidase/acylaminoacyl peptidase
MTEQLGTRQVGVGTLLAPSGSPMAATGVYTSEVYDTWSPSPSPDGRWVAVVSDRGGLPQAWLHLAGPGAPLLLDTGAEPVVRVSWAPDGEWIGCVLAPGGSPRTEVWVVRPDGSQLRQVAGFGGTAGLLTGWVPSTGELMATETGATGRALLIDPATGASRVIAEGDLLCLLDIAPDGSRALVRLGPRGARWLEVLDLATGESRPLVVGEGSGSTDRGWFSADGRTVYARTDVGTDLAALVAVGPDGTSMLAWRPDAELEDFNLTEDRRTVALLWNRYGVRSELTLLDLGSLDQRSVPPPPGEVFEGCAFSADGSLLCLVAHSIVRSRTVWLVDLPESSGLPAGVEPAASAGLATGSGRDLGEDPMTSHAAVPAGDPWPVVTAPQLCDLRSGDGLTISGWLYRPEGEGPWPTVLCLHGGPEAQERPGYNPLFQLLVAQGVAVFAPNVRGSSGFGRAFLEADNRAGRYGAIADVAACVEFLVESGVASRDRIGCMGRSYGGYLTLIALVTFPELFAVGVSECGMSNFDTFYARSEPWISAAAISKYGDPEHDRDLLRDLSPIHRIDRLTAPLLLIHGENDTNVPVYESEQVVAALAGRGAKHDYLLVPGEGHDFLSRANRQTVAMATVDWLTRHLQPERAEAVAPAATAAR